MALPTLEGHALLLKLDAGDKEAREKVRGALLAEGSIANAAKVLKIGRNTLIRRLNHDMTLKQGIRLPSSGQRPIKPAV